MINSTLELEQVGTVDPRGPLNLQSSMSNDQSSMIPTARARAFNIPGDEVNQASESFPADQKDMVRWLHAYAWHNNIHLDDLAQMLKRPDGKSYDGHTLYRIFKGIYEGKLDKFCACVASFRRVIDERADITRAPFVMTRLAKRIFKICESAKIYQSIEFIFGESQIGKSAALEEFARQHNHGMTVYWRLPAGGGLRRSVEELAVACRISAQQKTVEVLRRAVRFFTSEMLLIVDEAHQMFLSENKQGKIETAELIREIHDRCKCGVVIAATPALQRELQEGKNKLLLRQLDLRSLGPNVLPAKPDAKDLAIFAAHFGLGPIAQNPDAQKIQNEVIAYEGLGRWLKRLMAASRIASKREEKLHWKHVIDADTAIRRKATPTLD